MVLDPDAQQEAYRASVARFAADRVAPLAASIDEDGQFPAELIREAGAMGLLGITVPRAEGGEGRDFVSYSLAIEALAHASATVAVIVAVHNSLVAEVLAAYGTEAQRRRWLRPLVSGAALGSFALSEEQAGTDAANQQTVATPDGDGYRLRGRKIWVANAAAADLAIVFAATQPGAGGRGVTAFLVPLDAPGLRGRASAESLGVRGLGCMDLDLEDVPVGRDQVLGAPEEGFPMAMWALDGGRIAIAAQALGVGRAALDEALRHARRRHTFGRPLASYQAIQWMLADMATELEAARVLTLKAAAVKDAQMRCTREAAMAKLAASEAAHRAADRAMQILASAGYRRGSTVERLFRDVRATEIYQGTSEVQRMVIAAEVIGRRS